MAHSIKRYNGMPCSRLGWYEHFAKLAELREGWRKDLLIQVATWYYILHLAFDDES